MTLYETLQALPYDLEVEIRAIDGPARFIDKAGYLVEDHPKVTNLDYFELVTEIHLPDDTPKETPTPPLTGSVKVADELERLRVRDEAWRQFQVEQHPPRALPEIRSLRDRLKDPPPEVVWRVDGWQPSNTRVMLAAQFKAGKTTLTGNLARCLVDGDWWLDTAAVTKVNGGHVSIVDFEMSERQIDGWLKDQGIINDDRVVIAPLRGAGAAFNIIDDTTRARWVEQLAGTEYLILDCLRPILDALGLDEHKDGGRFLTAFDALCTEAQINDSLIVHHMGHTGERSRGDSRFRDWPDVEWRLVREGDDPASPRYISAYGRDVEVLESQLAYNPATRHLRLAGGNRANAAARRALNDIIVWLEESGEPASKTAIEQGVGADSDHTRDAIRKGLEIGIHGLLILRTKGPRKTLLHTLNAKPPMYDRQTSVKALSVRQNPIGVGALDYPFGEDDPQAQNAAEFNPPETEPW